MRYVATLILLMLGFQSWAQKPTSTIRFSTTNNDNITVILNDRDFKKIGRSITFRDLPRKRHSVQIYRVGYNEQTGRNTGTTIYSGTIKLEPGKTYDAIYNGQTRQLRLYTVKELPQLTSGTMPEPVNNQVEMRKSSDGLNDVLVTPLENSDISIPVSFESNLNKDMLDLKKQIEAATLDKEKIELAQKYMANKALSAYDGRALISWILFEENKVALAEMLKSNIKDKENLDMLADAFTYEQSKTQFLNSLK